METDILLYRLNEVFRKFRDYAAVEKGNHTLTYDQLDKRSDAVAHRILEKGMKKESFIGILLDCPMQFIVVVIGILKAGCVFVPLDTAYPEKRLTEMIQATDIEMIIGDAYNFERLRGGGGLKKQGVAFIDIDDINFGGKTAKMWEDKTPTAGRYSAEDKVYIYFTSGTTGKSKAIVGKNKSLLHFINWEIETFGIDETFRFSQFTNPGFDVYLRDIFVPLCAGAVVCIPGDKEIIINSQRLVTWIDCKEITLIHCVPSLFRLFNIPHLQPGYFKSLKYVLFAGEKIIPKELVNWYEKIGERIQLVNLYGPTETTLAKVFYPIQKSDAHRQIMPIGKHIKGARVIILDENMEVCRTLEVGELYIRTPYRTHGYSNGPQLNAEKFIANPFNNDPDDILYKTGDLGRFLPDGNIELIGRIDRQVKIRGMRVELDEIENTLLQHPAVKEAVVIKRQVTEINEFLAALITRKDQHEQNIEKDERFNSRLKQFLSEQLPGYMVPNYTAVIELMPRKVNGKIDYDRILEIVKEMDVDHTASRNPFEERLVGIWSELLGFKTIGVRSSFFDLGGNSLTAMHLVNRVHKEFNAKISLKEVFKYNTIEEQARLVTNAAVDSHLSIEAVEKKEYYPLSSAQKRLYTLHQMNTDSTRYNIYKVIRLQGGLDKNRMEDSFKQLIQRHESLRTTFDIKDDEPVQRIHSRVEFAIEQFDLQERQRQIRGGPGDKEIVKAFFESFELFQAPLMRVGLIIEANETYTLLINMHHIISDVTSMKIFEQEFKTLYLAGRLPGLKLQYKDFSEWRNSLFNSNGIKRQEDYWLNQFKGDIPSLNMSLDYPRPSAYTGEGNTISFDIDKAAVAKLRQLVSETGATTYILLLAVYNILLSKYTGQEDIVVGTPTAGRRHTELEHIIGIFINMLPMRNRPQREKTFSEFLHDVKINALDAYENQDCQFEELIWKLNLKADYGRNPLFDAVFVVQNAAVGEIEMDKPNGSEEIEVLSYDIEKEKIHHELHLTANEGMDKIFFKLEYSTELYKESTARMLVKHYGEILEQILENKDLKLEDIKISHDLVAAYSDIINYEEGDFRF